MACFIYIYNNNFIFYLVIDDYYLQNKKMKYFYLKSMSGITKDTSLTFIK